MTIAKKIFAVIILAFLQCSLIQSEQANAVQPVKKVYIKKEGEKYFFCVDFVDGVKFSPRIHMLSNGAKLILSFNEEVKAPQTRRINHSIINGYFFEQFGQSSLMMVLSLKENAIFTEKRYTQNSIKIGFNIVKKRVIVVDAGHGGRDPGTKCITGDSEKNITMIIAIELKNLLEESGRYKVVFTRDSDTFISIQARRDKIVASNGELMISLHTDSNDDRNIRGISVYTLPNLEFIKQNDDRNAFNQDADSYYKTLAFSRKFSDILVGYIPNMCKIKNRPCRNVELKILKSQIPAVLIELGCVSNEKDNQLLHSRDFREKVCNAILYALDNFFEQSCT
jgi:N-acetylmuramoyl-L-alanine amidase